MYSTSLKITQRNLWTSNNDRNVRVRRLKQYTHYTLQYTLYITVYSILYTYVLEKIAMRRLTRRMLTKSR